MATCRISKDTHGEPPLGVDASVRFVFAQAQNPDPGARGG